VPGSLKCVGTVSPFHTAGSAATTTAAAAAARIHRATRLRPPTAASPAPSSTANDSSTSGDARSVDRMARPTTLWVNSDRSTRPTADGDVKG